VLFLLKLSYDLFSNSRRYDNIDSNEIIFMTNVLTNLGGQREINLNLETFNARLMSFSFE
jgi:hypothetical protein